MSVPIEAAYQGCRAIHIADRTVAVPRGAVLPQAARMLLADGMDPRTVLRVTRDGTRVFADTTLGAWAGIATEERAERSVRFVPFRPLLAAASKSDGGAAVEALEAA